MVSELVMNFLATRILPFVKKHNILNTLGIDVAIGLIKNIKFFFCFHEETLYNLPGVIARCVANVPSDEY